MKRNGTHEPTIERVIELSGIETLHPRGMAMTTAGPVSSIDTAWSRLDRLEHLRCRVGSFRNRYAVAPGLYAVGRPGPASEVLVTANYKLSFDHLRRALDGLDAWVVVSTPGA